MMCKWLFKKQLSIPAIRRKRLRPNPEIFHVQFGKFYPSLTNDIVSNSLYCFNVILLWYLPLACPDELKQINPMAQYVLEEQMALWEISTEKNTPLTGIEESGKNWAGAREYCYMASSPSYRGWWLRPNSWLVNVSCSCKVCNAALSLVCWSTEGERRGIGDLEQEIHPLGITLAYVHTSLHKTTFLQFCLTIADAWFPVGQREEVGFTDWASKIWLTFVAFCLYYPMVPIDIRALYSFLLYTHYHRMQENISVFQTCVFFFSSP